MHTPGQDPVNVHQCTLAWLCARAKCACACEHLCECICALACIRDVNVLTHACSMLVLHARVLNVRAACLPPPYHCSHLENLSVKQDSGNKDNMCIYIYICIYIPTHTHACTHTHVHTCARTHTHTHAHARVHVLAQTDGLVRTHGPPPYHLSPTSVEWTGFPPSAVPSTSRRCR